jgi:hypothetical protein
MTDKPKITNIKDARSRATANKKNNNRAGASVGYDQALRKQKGQGGGLSGNFGSIRWFHYVQLLLMLGLVAWLMKACQV